MSNIVKTSIATNASCSAVTGLTDIGSLYPTGHLSIYTYDSTQLTWHALGNPAFQSPTDGTAFANTINDATVLTDGTASYFTFENRDGNPLWGGEVSLSDGTGALKLETLSLAADSTVVVVAAQYIVPS
jgi:hypothetical protein